MIKRAGLVLGLFILLSLIGTLGCSPDQAKQQSHRVSLDDQARLTELLENPGQIVFSDVKSLVLSESCMGCHSGDSAASGIDFSSFEKMTEEKTNALILRGEPEESLLFQTLDAKAGPLKMPPAGSRPLSRDQIDLVRKWIQFGAPEKLGEVSPILSLEELLEPYFERPGTIDYGTIKKWVFEPGRCFSCHSTSGYRADNDAIIFGADMSSYSQLFVLNGIVKGRPSHTLRTRSSRFIQPGSSIYKAIATDQSMPPASEGYQPLSALRVKLLRLWILNCAIEDYDSSQTELLNDDSNTPGKVRRCF